MKVSRRCKAMITPTSSGGSSHIIRKKHFKCQTCERCHATGTRAREPTSPPLPELRLHAIIVLYLYHGSSEVALDAAMADSPERYDDGLCRV